MADGPQPQKIPLIFYRTEAGSEPVREWLKGLPVTDRQAIGKDLLRAQWRWPVGMPPCRPLKAGKRDVVFGIEQTVNLGPAGLEQGRHLAR